MPISRQGFTLVELLVVMGIILILVSIAIPAINQARNKAKDTEVKSGCNQIQAALEQYAVTHSSFYPGAHWVQDSNGEFEVGPGVIGETRAASGSASTEFVAPAAEDRACRTSKDADSRLHGRRRLAQATKVVPATNRLNVPLGRSSGGFPRTHRTASWPRPKPVPRSSSRRGVATPNGPSTNAPGCPEAGTRAGCASFLADRFAGDEARRFHIPPPPADCLEVDTAGGLRTIPLDEVRPLIQAACNVCPDMTSEFADLSVGMYEGRDGWNTLITRSDTGQSLIDRAVAQNVLELDFLPGENLLRLKQASLKKRDRAPDHP